MPSISMKVYDLAWFTYFGKDYARAAHALREDGVDFVLTQNQIDPLPISGVDQRRAPSRYSDRQWTEALKREGLITFQTTASFFAPSALQRFPDARPMNALGQADYGFDWYVGVCPTDHDYLDWKIDRLGKVIDRLDFDGYFLQFTRWPGFWENWTPEFKVSSADMYCFCDRCRREFARDAAIDLKAGDLRAQAQEILSNHRERWNAWRSERLGIAIAMLILGSGANANGLATMLNTLPFASSDFSGADVRRTVFGQDIKQLEKVIGHFELMTYLQILNRPREWIKTVVEDARSQTSRAQIMCTLQVSPLYTSGVHADRDRCETLTPADLEKAADVALEAGADGLVFYHWGDFLEDEAEGGAKREALRRITRKAKDME